MVRKMCPVDVISVCSANGDIRPLRLRVEDEEREGSPLCGRGSENISVPGVGGRAAMAVRAEIPHPCPLLVPDGQGVLIFHSGNYREIVVLWW